MNRNKKYTYKPKLIIGADCKTDFSSVLPMFFLVFRLYLLYFTGWKKKDSTIEYVSFNIHTHNIVQVSILFHIANALYCEEIWTRAYTA